MFKNYCLVLNELFKAIVKCINIIKFNAECKDNNADCTALLFYS